MMRKNIKYLVYTIVYAFLSCSSSPEIGKIFNISDTQNKKVIYRIDNECPLCIGEFLKFYMAFKDSDIEVIYIAKPENKMTFDYYLEKNEIKLPYKTISNKDIKAKFPVSKVFSSLDHFVLVLDQKNTIIGSYLIDKETLIQDVKKALN